MRPIFAAPIAMLGLELISETQRMQAHDGSPYGFARRHVGAAQPPPQADMFQCPGVDVDAFAEDCRAVIFPDMWNAWRLLKSTADGVTASSPEYETDAANEARALLTKLQGEGTIRHVEVKVGGPANPWGTPVIQDRNSVCAHPMVLRASKYQPPYLEVYVRFVYRHKHVMLYRLFPHKLQSLQ